MCYGFIFIPMWLIYMINNMMLSSSMSMFFGINPRVFELSELFAINFSWMAHSDFSHISNNSMVLLG